MQVLLKWNIQRGVPVTPKATSAEHLAANLVGMYDWRLTWQQKSKLDGMDAGKRYVHLPGHTWPDAEEGGASKPSVVFGYA